MLDFKPPRENTFIINSARMLLPFLLHRFHKVVEIDVDEMYDDVPDATAYTRKIHAQRTATFMKFHTELNRLINFNAIYDGYVAANPNQERYLEVIARFEVEVFGRSRVRGPTKAMVRIGEPVNLLESYEDYRREKRTTTQRITLELEGKVQDLVNQSLS